MFPSIEPTGIYKMTSGGTHSVHTHYSTYNNSYMKKIALLTIVASIVLQASGQQAGRVKVSFAGFKCLRETADDILHLDGKADEVFLRFYFTLADRNGNTKLKYSNQTDIYGDNYGPFGNRVNAGSAVDLFGNLRGGIKGGDNRLYEINRA